MRVLHVDLDRRAADVESWAEELVGGRRLTAEIVSSTVDPGCDPLGPENALVLAAGPLAGWHISCADRLSVGGKSPLTHGIKESNAGGIAAQALAGLDYRAVALRGSFSPGEPGIVVVDEAGVRFAAATEYWGLRLEETAARLRAEFGPDYAYVAVGPAGEMQLPAAAIAVSDVHGQPFRFAARGGLGAVMGSKGLKAVVLRNSPRPRPRVEALKAAIRAFHRVINDNPRVEVMRKYGTAATVMLTQTLGGLPTRNFSQGRFEQADRISGEALYELTVARGGEGTPTEGCMATCLLQCSNVFPDAQGRRLVAPIEYETLVMCGPNLGIGDPDTIAGLNRQCNEIGLDTIEIGAVLGVAAEGGLWDFGDGARAQALVDEIGQGTVLGRLLGQGCATVARVLGVRRVPAVKGQALGAYDPRGVKGMGVTYATSPMGGDHTAGLTVFAPVDHLSANGQVELSRDTQVTRAAYDALGLCVFLLGSTGSRPDLLSDMLNAAYGMHLEPHDLAQLGRQVIALERAYNRRAGLTVATDCLPSFFHTEPLPPHGNVFDISDEDLAKVWEE